MGIKMINDITVNVKNVNFCYEAGKNILNNVKNSNSIRVVKTNEKEFNELQKNKKNWD